MSEFYKKKRNMIIKNYKYLGIKERASFYSFCFSMIILAAVLCDHLRLLTNSGNNKEGGTSIVTCAKRAMVTLLPEWEQELDQLKQEQFHNDTRAEMFRYIIARGLDTLKREKAAKKKGGIRHPKTLCSPRSWNGHKNEKEKWKMGNLVKKDVEQEKKNFTEVEKAIEKTYEIMKEFMPKDKAFRAFIATVIAFDPEKHTVSDSAGWSRTQTCKEIERKLWKEGHWIELRVIKQIMEKRLMELGPIFVGKELVTGSFVEPRGDDPYRRTYLRYDPEKVMLYLDFN